MVNAMFQFVYKCRLCGKSFRNTGAGSRQNTVVILEETMAQGRQTSVPDRVLHWCDIDKHGAVIEMGIADLIGAKHSTDNGRPCNR